MTGPKVDLLRAQHAIYFLGSGRGCMTGFTTASVHWVARAIATVLAANAETTVSATA